MAEPAPAKTSTEVQEEAEDARQTMAFNTAGFAANILSGGLGDTSTAKVKRYRPS